MKVTLVGFKSLDFTSNEGNQVKGVKLFYAYPDADVSGNATDDVFLAQNVFDSFGVSVEQLNDSVDCIIELEFGKRGKVVGLKVA